MSNIVDKLGILLVAIGVVMLLFCIGTYDLKENPYELIYSAMNAQFTIVVGFLLILFMKVNNIKK